ncbi:BTAD domain-containing putative transcriptional regulator [Actinosynnema sp. CS-041913]|uniref:BTAD domain-containing putative transcriptional regulator n=1 Tax=Actinosynnema sp. CS-041913 TaxID=3239917 RepID=UPI003D8A477C
MSDGLPLFVELLGPVRAWRAGTEIDVGAARRRAVFTVLAVRAGQAVSREELIDGVWGDAPPATAGASLYTYVSGLRRAFEPQRSKRSTAEIIVSTGGGYSLRIDQACLDVHRFEQHRVRAQALADTDAAGALGELEQALALWRGDPLFEVPGPFAEAQRARLQELRLATVERRAELALAVGRHADLATELPGLIAEHPMREGLRALLVTALHRAGRQAEALEVYREAHRVLVDELGIEPGLALRRAHREVRGGDGPREAAVVADRPHRAPAADAAGTGFVGRDRELALLRRAVADVAAGRGRAVWLDGEAGIGKSALLTAGLADAADAGCRVVRATADELGGRFPLRVVLDCLDETALDRRQAEAPVDAAAGWQAGDPVPAVADRLLACVEELCAEAPLVLVVDGAQWADEASVLFWRRLLRLAHRLPLLLVAAARPVPRRVDVAGLRHAVADAGGDVVELAALPAAEVAALVTGLVGAPPGDNLRRLAGQAGGNPRYTRETVDALMRDGLVEFCHGVAEVDADAVQELPPSLVSALTRWLGFLSPKTAEVLRWAALLGAEFSVRDAATATGQPVAELMAAVDEAVASGVLASTGSRLAFRHPVLRHALYHRLPGAVRTALHRQLAECLTEAGAPAEVVAGQLAAAPTVVDPWVVDWLAENAHAVERSAPDVAARVLRAVVDQPALDRTHRERLTARLADLLFRLGRRPDAEARQVLARTQDPGLAAEMRWMLLHLRHSDGEAAGSVDVLRAAVDDDGVPAVWRARLGALLAATHSSGDEAEETARRALRRAEETGDDFAAALSWQALWHASAGRLDHEEALTRVDRALAVVRTRADLEVWQTMLSADKAATLRHLDRLADADLVLRAGREAADSRASGGLHIAAAVQNYWLGRWDDAEREAGASEPGPRRTGSAFRAHGLAALVAARRGCVEIARDHLRAAADRRPVTAMERESAGFQLAAEAFVAETTGRLDQAVAALEPLLGTPRTPARHQWLPLLTRLALAAGRRDIAGRAARLCAEDASAERVRAGASAAAAHCFGLVDGDPEPVLAAVARYRDVGRPVEAAEALESAAALLVACGDDAGARAALDGAVAGYGRLGAVLDVRRAEERLRRTA